MLGGGRCSDQSVRPRPTGTWGGSSAHVTYGWGMIPVTARIGSTSWTTSLFPKDGRYIVPLKVVVRRAEGIDDGDVVSVELEVDA